MEFLTVPCPGKGKVSIDGHYQGDNKVPSDGQDQGERAKEELNVFQCGRGTHNISMECLVGKHCKETVQRAQVEDTDPIIPMEVEFECSE